MLVLLAGCTAGTGDVSLCEPPRRTGTLPDPVNESSGIAASRAHAGVLWTHNDSGGRSVVFAIDTAGRLLGRVRVAGASNRDWEDLALGPCEAGDCLYIADTGDNDADREDVAIYRIPEPAPGDTLTGPAERFPIRFPGGPRDTEALYVLPDGDLYLVTKGRNAPVTLFRYPAPLRDGEAVELERVRELGEGAEGLLRQVTGAAASADGHWVAIRTYSAVQLYRVGRGGRLRAWLEPPGLDLQTLAEPQGEAVAFEPDGTLVLTSEAASESVPGTVARLACPLD